MTVDDIGKIIFGDDWDDKKKQVRGIRKAIEGTMEILGQAPPRAQTRIDLVYRAVYDAVEAYYGCTREDIYGRHRIRTITDARMMAIHLAKKYTGFGESQLTREFNFRDRSTIIWCRHRLEELLVNPSVRNDMEELEFMVEKRLEEWKDVQL